MPDQPPFYTPDALEAFEALGVKARARKLPGKAADWARDMRGPVLAYLRETWMRLTKDNALRALATSVNPVEIHRAQGALGVIEGLERLWADAANKENFSDGDQE